MNSWLAAYTSLPNLHPALVHFPIALLTAALVLDIATLLARRRWWTDPAAAALYAAGAIGAGAAYLAGEAAEESLTSVPPAAELVLAAHADWALRTLLWFATLAVARLLVAWLNRGSDDIRMRWARIGLLLGGLAGQYLLFQTADHGGALVYRHGVAVARPASAPPHPAPDAAASATGTPPAGLPRQAGSQAAASRNRRPFRARGLRYRAEMAAAFPHMGSQPPWETDKGGGRKPVLQSHRIRAYYLPGNH